jgi:integrase
MATVKFRIRPKGNPEKETAIHCYYYHEGIEIEKSTGLKVIPANWANSRVTTPKNKINKLLAERESALLNLHIDYTGKSNDELEVMAGSIIKGRPVTKTTEEKKTLIQAVQLFIAQYEREKETGTVKRYKGLLKKLVGFEAGTERNTAPLLFENLDFNFYDAFKKFLYNCYNPVYGGCSLRYDIPTGCYHLIPDLSGDSVGLFDDTVFKYFVNLKTICAWASKRGYAVHPSYKEWEILKREYPPITLTKDELEAIEALDLPQHLDIARDYLSLECRTGQRISDLRRFSKADLNNDVWSFFQKKGNRIKAKHIELPLDGFSFPALGILEKYNHELPKISEQKLNEHIKTVCRMAGITEGIYIERWAGSRKIRISGPKWEFISTHTGKKSFITIMASEGVPVSFLSLLTGTSQKTIERHYLGKISLDKVREQLNKGGKKESTMRIAN